MALDLQDLITLEEAAEIVGRSPVTLRQAVGRGRLDAVKIGKTWITTHDAVSLYVATTRERKRPGRRLAGRISE